MRQVTGDAGSVAPWLIDALVAVFVALAIALIIVTDLGGRQPGAAAYLFAVGFGALMLIRRRMPRVVLVATTLGLFAYYTFDYPPIGVAVPVVAALYSAAESGRLWSSIVASAVVLSVSTFFRVRDGESVAYLLGYELVSNVALMAAAIALGDSIRARATIRREEREINRLTAERVAQEAERRMQRQREGIARDLHDVVGHTMSVISLHANVAAEAIDRSDLPAAGAATGLVRDASERTMRELRGTVRLLRSATDDGDSTVPVSLANLDGLADVARSAGPEVVTDVDAPLDRLSAGIDAAAYRIVQEALTNAIRHSGATQIRVRLRLDDEVLRVTVCDNGRGVGPLRRAAGSRTPGPDGNGAGTEPDGPGETPVPDAAGGTGETRVRDAAGGHGIAGMTERARLLGGTLTVRSGAGGGCTVEARLPARLTP